ncbi:MAG: hypothetical protein AAFQ43_06370, partial [Bacteroidota bacterium]
MLALLLATALALPDTTLPEASPMPPPAPPVVSPEAAGLVSPDTLDARPLVYRQRPLAATDTVPDPVIVRPRLAPTALYSNSRGFGIAGGIAVENAGWQGSQTALDLRLSQRYQGIAFSLYTADPFESPLYGHVSAEATQTTRRR